MTTATATEVKAPKAKAVKVAAPKAEKVVKEKAPKAEKPVVESKASKARAIFAAETAKGTARKDIIALFISDVGLTKAGASTYYEKFRKNQKVTNA